MTRSITMEWRRLRELIGDMHVVHRIAWSLVATATASVGGLWGRGGGSRVQSCEFCCPV